MATRQTVTQGRSGTQPRAYAGDEWSGTIRFEMQLGERDWEPWTRVPNEEVRRWVQFVTHYKDPEDGDWYTPRLKTIDQVEPGLFRYLVERPYDD